MGTNPSTPAGWLDRAATAGPDTPALLGRGFELSYAELRRAVASLCVALRARGVGRGSTLALNCSSGLLVALAIHAAPRLGYTPFPLPGSDRSGRAHASLLARAGVDCMLTDAPEPDPNRLTMIEAGSLQAAMGKGRGFESMQPLSNDDIHLMLATSGSTGTPKVVGLSGRNLAASVAAVHPRLGLARGDRWLCVLPLYHIGGLAILFRCAAAAATVLIHAQFDASAVLRDLQGQSVTHISLVPAMLARLLDACADGPPPEGLRVLLVGGGPLSPRLASRARKAGWPLYVTYGLSETASQLCVDAPPVAGRIPGRVGPPLAGVELRLGPARPGAPAPIQVRGGMVMEGYVNPRRRGGDGLHDGWLETGDLGTLDEDGILYLAGRADDVLVSGGETVHPAEVELLLRECPAVEAVAVSATRDEVWGDRLVAIYVGSLDEHKFERWVRSRLHGVRRPRRFLRVARIPVDNPDKPDRRALRCWVESRYA